MGKAADLSEFDRGQIVMARRLGTSITETALLWAQEHRDWTMDAWKRVSWSDESRFLIHHVDGRVRVHRLPDEQLLLSCTAGHTQAVGGSIMLRGTFSWAALGP
ncbi:hypothetical protein AVEN_200095-1 [Araneus ventricosus]|uniref:Transposase Tc1-like domain-containing protein n=1 Tax=Araneus ventricosus TaxID=182803 RepID=A0A4Y2JR31_ARAVE|nr:hypothetical protein AVEN_200095-1 [Araneus ventricosus]